MKRKILIIIVLGLLILPGWCFIRQMNIFVVDNKFACLVTLPVVAALSAFSVYFI